jgi:hypothetical protein
LLIDTSESVSGALQESLRAGVHQLAAALKSDDRVRLIAVSHALQLMPESEPAQLASVRLPDPRGGTSLYDGLALALIRPGPADRRHLIMAFTDGRDTTSITAPSALLPLSRASDAVAYIVAAGSGPTTTIQEPAGLIGDVFSAARSLPRTVSVPLTREHVDPEGTLGEVASTTGGDLLLLPEHRSLAGSFARILSDFRTSYVLTYGPAGVKAGGWHELKISVRRPGRYEVRARKGYSREARR